MCVCVPVRRYEEMMRKYHPGVGDHRWPLITHFVGCKPCGKLEQLDPEETRKCFHEMNRCRPHPIASDTEGTILRESDTLGFFFGFFF